MFTIKAWNKNILTSLRAHDQIEVTRIKKEDAMTICIRVKRKENYLFLGNKKKPEIFLNFPGLKDYVPFNSIFKQLWVLSGIKLSPVEGHIDGVSYFSVGCKKNKIVTREERAKKDNLRQIKLKEIMKRRALTKDEFSELMLRHSGEIILVLYLSGNGPPPQQFVGRFFPNNGRLVFPTNGPQEYNDEGRPIYFRTVSFVDPDEKIAKILNEKDELIYEDTAALRLWGSFWKKDNREDPSNMPFEESVKILGEQYSLKAARKYLNGQKEKK